MVHSEDSFYVAGFSARTNNAKEASGQGVIGRLWQDVYQKNLGAQIPNRMGADTIVVYSDTPAMRRATTPICWERAYRRSKTSLRE